MTKLLFQSLIAATLGLAALCSSGAGVDELIQACEKLKRAEDRATCLKEAVRAASGSSAVAKAQNQTDAAVVAAEGVTRALRRLTSAATVGINLRDYSQLVVTESANIDEALRTVPEGPFKDAVLKSRQAYIDARDVWSASIRLRYVSTFRSSVAPILRRYAIDPSLLDGLPRDATTSDMPVAFFLSPIWTAARLGATEADAAMVSRAERPPLTPPPSAPSSSSIADQPIETRATPRRSATADDQRVLRALRLIDESADTGLGFVEYSNLISKGFVEVDHALRLIPDDDFRANVVAARKAYADAREVWALSDQYQYVSLFSEAAGPTLRLYWVGPSILNGTGVREMRLMPKHIFLFPIWRFARQHIDDAQESLLNAESGTASPAQAGARRGQ